MSKDKETTDNNMILVEAGRFEMERYRKKNLIRITKDFLINKHLVTFDEYDEFSKNEGKEKPDDEGWGRGNRPIIHISWYDAIEYCNWKSRKENGLEEVYTINKSVKDINNVSIRDKFKWTVTCDFDKNGYRLPTEAEWEFAARGGNKSKGNYKYSGSDDIDEVAWYYDNSGNKTQSVGQKKSNELGIYDMSGNVDEWCWDYYSGDDLVNYDPKGGKTGSDRVSRSGSWYNDALYCEVAFRCSFSPSFRFYNLGFRVSRTC